MALIDELPKCWVLFSGGKDSTCTAYYLANQNKLIGCLFLDTGIGTPDIIPFVKDICETRGWKIEIIRTPRSYETMVQKYGFPKPYSHQMYMIGLKLHALQVFRKQFGKVDLASGVRKGESKRRFKNVKGVSIINGMKCYAPIADWTDGQVWEYIHKNNLQISPAYEKLHISGDCLCGAFARREEIQLLRMFYPEVYERIDRLEQLVKGRKNSATWGNHGGVTENRGQTMLCAECEI